MRHILVVLLLVGFLAGCAGDPILGPAMPVEEYGSIEGVVELSDGGVAAGIEVTLYRVETTCYFCGPGTAYHRPVETTVANEDGRFRFAKVRVGRYAVDFGPYDGYHPATGFGDPPSFSVLEDRVAPVRRVLHRIYQTLTVATEAADGAVRVTATFTNNGDEPVSYYPACLGRWFILRDADDTWIHFEDPTDHSRCSSGQLELATGESATESIEVGPAWTLDGEPYYLPPGNYTVEVNVLYTEGELPYLRWLKQSVAIDLQ